MNPRSQIFTARFTEEFGGLVPNPYHIPYQLGRGRMQKIDAVANYIGEKGAMGLAESIMEGGPDTAMELADKYVQGLSRKHDQDTTPWELLFTNGQNYGESPLEPSHQSASTECMLGNLAYRLPGNEVRTVTDLRPGPGKEMLPNAITIRDKIVGTGFTYNAIEDSPIAAFVVAVRATELNAAPDTPAEFYASYSPDLPKANQASSPDITLISDPNGLSAGYTLVRDLLSGGSVEGIKGLVGNIQLNQWDSLDILEQQNALEDRLRILYLKLTSGLIKRSQLGNAPHDIYAAFNSPRRNETQFDRSLSNKHQVDSFLKILVQVISGNGFWFDTSKYFCPPSLRPSYKRGETIGLAFDVYR